MNLPILPIVITGVGLVVVLLGGILGWVVVPNIIDDKIIEEVRLINNTETWDKWSDIPLPIYLTFYIHHVKNPDEVEMGEKPDFETKGPYAYRQYRSKKDLAQRDRENPLNTVQYKEVKEYFFDEGRSGEKLTEDDRVNVVNIAFIAVVSGIKSQLAVLAPFVANVVLGSESLIKRNVRVGDLLFDGFDVSLYTNSFIGGMLPVEFSGSRFGLYKGENGTKSDEYNIHTGVDNADDFGRIETWNGSTVLHYWREGTECDKIKGTDGSVFGPFFTKERQFDVFSTDLCRSLTFTYDSEMEHEGIKGYRFTLPDWALEDPRTNRDNMCYCMEAEEEDCPRSGAMNIATCKGGAPIMMSTPHFLDGYSGYLENSGLSPPNRDEHITHIDVEPNTGVVLLAHKRIQVNLDIKMDTSIRALAGLKADIVFPILWADESAEMDKENADDLKGKLLTPLKIVNIAKWAVLGVGIGVVVGGVVLYFVRR